MTLLDYPGKVACTVFLTGCNFRCPFCHNSEILDGTCEPVMTPQELLNFLQKRIGLLDGVCITGGEPTLHPQLPDLLKDIKALGYSIKLDSNGYRPAVLKELVAQGLVDYIAMDIKNGPSDYCATAGNDHLDLSRIEESIRFLGSGPVDYEFRTTVVDQLHSEQSILEMGKWLQELTQGRAKKLFLQKFVDRDTVMFAGLCAPDEEKMERFKQILQPFAQQVAIRGEG